MEENYKENLKVIFMRKFSLRYLDKIEEVLIIAAVLIAEVIIFINVVLRYCFRYSLDWPNEVAEFLLIAITFLACSAAVKSNNHIRIDVIAKLFPFLDKYIQKIGNLLFLVFAIVVVILSTQYFIELYSMRLFKISAAAEIPMYLPYFAVPLGSALLMIRLIQWFWANWKGKNED